MGYIQANVNGTISLVRTVACNVNGVIEHRRQLTYNHNGALHKMHGHAKDLKYNIRMTNTEVPDMDPIITKITDGVSLKVIDAGSYLRKYLYITLTSDNQPPIYKDEIPSGLTVSVTITVEYGWSGTGSHTATLNLDGEDKLFIEPVTNGVVRTLTYTYPGGYPMNTGVPMYLALNRTSGSGESYFTVTVKSVKITGTHCGTTYNNTLVHKNTLVGGVII